MHLHCLLNSFSKLNEKKVYEPHYFNNLCEKFIHMRIVEDEYGNRFLEIENKEDFRKFKEDLLKRAKEKANARKPSYEIQPPK